ncbi:hypothetical protein [Antrihabitans sp. YC2-6]|uniref:hypothetical protein n=1 Tax=Antrihabitans sp. YC2-6 TaxID=2799498 RepID=UPI0018F471E0|nr:hypothetical protein [Antrihabitans sp. YC2-6]MBJ8344354.1 hypothetical protein [Antrihabitans sp. YC2-6]
MRTTVITAGALAVAIALIGAAPASAVPASSMSDGLYIVGVDIAPGNYSTSGPDEDFGCYWERLSGTSGEFDDIISNDYIVAGRSQVTIKPTDYAFDSHGCGTWTLRASST